MLSQLQYCPSDIDVLQLEYQSLTMHQIMYALVMNVFQILCQGLQKCVGTGYSRRPFFFLMSSGESDVSNISSAAEAGLKGFADPRRCKMESLLLLLRVHARSLQPPTTTGREVCPKEFPMVPIISSKKNLHY